MRRLSPKEPAVNITVIGATGMVGARVVAEAARRGHHVTAVSRSGKAVADATRAESIELGDTTKVAAAIDTSDATVIAVSPDHSGGSHEPLLRAHKDIIAARPKGRFLVVGGAGSLEVGGV